MAATSFLQPSLSIVWRSFSRGEQLFGGNVQVLCHDAILKADLAKNLLLVNGRLPTRITTTIHEKLMCFDPYLDL